MTIEQAIEYLRSLDLTARKLSIVADRYRTALKQIRQIGINESDSVLAATEMERVASETLKEVL